MESQEVARLKDEIQTLKRQMGLVAGPAHHHQGMNTSAMANNLSFSSSSQVYGGGGGSGGISWFNINWNTKWFSEVKLYEGYWIAEFKIPFNSIRYKEGSKVWNFNSYR